MAIKSKDVKFIKCISKGHSYIEVGEVYEVLDASNLSSIKFRGKRGSFDVCYAAHEYFVEYKSNNLTLNYLIL